MPLADFRCVACNIRAEDQPFEMAKGAAADAPDCPECGHPMSWIPQIGRMDAKSDGGGGKGFQKFSVYVDGKETTVDSMHTLRKIERESEQRYRNGEGEPIRFRGYSQDASNIGESSFGDRGQIGERIYDNGMPLKKSGRVNIKKHGGDEPDIPVGPGVSKGGASAL